MLIPIAFGALAGFGLWCLVRAWMAPTGRLDLALAELSRQRQPTSVAVGGEGTMSSLSYRLASRLMGMTGATLHAFSADLALLGRSEEVHLVQRVKTAAFYGLFPLVGWVIITYIGGIVVVPVIVVVVLALPLAGGGWFMTDVQVRTRAAARRAEFGSVLVSYLSLVAVQMAAGSGVQQALHDSVEQGRGWAFVTIRRALTDARVRGISPWEAFEDHGSRLGLTALQDLAATVELAGGSGAQVRESLMSKAKALRLHELAAIEREARSRTSAMVGPTGLLLLGFVVLILYPAVQVILAI